MRPSTFFRGAATAIILSAALGATPVMALATESGADASAVMEQTSATYSDETAQSDASSQGAVASTAAGAASDATTSEKSAATPSTTPAEGSSSIAESSNSGTPAQTQSEEASSKAASECAQARPSANATVSAEESLDGKSYVIQNKKNGTRAVVDVSAGSKSNGANVQLYESNGTNAQRWTFRKNSDGTYAIVNQGSGKVLDVANGNLKSGGNVWQYESNGTAAQKWSIKWVDQSKGLANILLAAHPELALDAYAGSTSNGTNLQIWQANGTDAQIWYLRDLALAATEAVRKATGLDVVKSLDGSDYTIVSAADGKGLTVSGGSASAGAGLVFESANGTDRQAYRLTREGDFWRIRNMRSGLSVAVVNGDVVPGAAIRQEANSSDASQLWLLYRSNGKFGFINKATGLEFSNLSGLFSGIGFGTSAKNNELFSLNAWSPSVEEGLYRISSHLGNSQTLDVAGGSGASGANVQDYAWNGTTAQKWYVRNTGKGYAITNLGSGLRLAVSGTNAVQRGNDFLWGLKYVLGGGFSFVDFATGKALDVYAANRASGANVQIYSANGTAAQAWDFISVNAIEDGWYTIKSALPGRRALEVASAWPYNGANVRLWDSNGSDAQRWYIFGVGNGYYTFVNGASNKVLEVAGGSSASGANVQQYTGNGTNAQHWRFALVDGLFTFVNKSGKVLDVCGASDTCGANVQIWDSNGTVAQHWVLSTSDVSSKMRRLVAFENNMVAMANDDRHGYDQAYRWGERGDYDCSSLVITCLRRAGFSTGSASYTGNLRSNLQARGWQWITDVNSWEAQPGDIMLSEVHHVAAMVTHSTMVEARGNEYGEATGGRPGDQTGKEICISPWRKERGLHTTQGWDGILRFTGWC